jgi:hypothetical protein
MSVLAALGIVLCVAGTIGVWYVELRADRARQHLFERVGQALSSIDSRLVATQNLSAQSKFTVDDMQHGVQEWTKEKLSEGVAAHFDVEMKVQQLVKGLQQANLMLELSQNTFEHIGQALEVGNELGFSSDAKSVAPVLERLASLKDDLSRALDAVDSLGQRIHEIRDDESIADRTEQIATITARLIATFGKVDTRLVACRDRLTETQDKIGQLDTKTHRTFIAAAFCATLFLLWMLAGQLCLWRWARNR